MNQLKRWKWSYLLLTIAIMVLGVCLILWPGISAGVLCWILGAALCIFGIVRVLCYIQRGVSILWHRYELPLGLLDLLLGIYLLTQPENVLLLLPTVVAIVILVDSVFKLQTALELHRLNVSRWLMMLVLSLVTIFVAICLLRNPFEGAMTLMVYLGITLVVEGIQSLYFIHRMAKDVRKLLPIEAETIEVE